MVKGVRLLCAAVSAFAAVSAGAADFAVRAVQLDLARQIETVPFVKNYLRRSASAGFNTVVLYLEDRLKTPSYPYSEDAESYSIGEMKEIIETADGLGLDLVPVVSPLGHTDRFLRHKELRPFAETYECEGRYGSAPRAFCLENPAARAWMEKYLEEVMDVFPGKNIHLGFDETDDLGFCPRCRPIRERDGLGNLFVKHVNWAHGIAQRHGKRMWIWDDYFMFFPEALEKVPHDVVMCAWNYCPDLERTGFRNNFGGRLRRDVLREYEKLGFDCIPCCWFDTENIVRMVEYASSRKCLGLLQTQWEMTDDFHGCYFPRALGALSMWRGDASAHGDGWLSAGVKAAMPSLSDSGVAAAVSLLADQSRMRIRTPTLAACQNGRVPLSAIAAWKGAVMELKHAPSAPGTGDVPTDPLDEAGLLDDLVTRTEAVILLGEVRNAARALTSPWRTAETSRAAKDALRKSLAPWRRVCARRREQWRMWRPGDPTDLLLIETNFVNFVTEALEIRDSAADDEWTLEVDLTMADAYGVPYWRVEGCFNGEWRQLAKGGWKPGAGSPAYFAKSMPVTLSEPPSKLRIVYRGYGAGEICHVSLYNRSRRLVPSRIVKVTGDVRDADNLLVDDLRSVRLGNPDCTAAILNPALAAVESSVEIEMDAGAAAAPVVGCAGVPAFGFVPAGCPDPTLPRPAEVTYDAAGRPSDAEILFDGKDLSAWRSMDGGPARWPVLPDGTMKVDKTGNTPDKVVASIYTRSVYTNFQLHVEFRIPEECAKESSQWRGNSGVKIFGCYEVQILDSYRRDSYANGLCGALYCNWPPAVVASKPLGEWQSYDIVFHAPVVEDSVVKERATVTVLQNGVVVQDHVHTPPYPKTPANELRTNGDIELQSHNDASAPISFRNVWIRRLPPREPLVEGLNGDRSRQVLVK